ncbi:MAG: hypothetical protein K8R87_07290 [Verrucomicrobia bacterium]|nr:hypothetical protein [Verrucomicrobiota bacterium]
MNRPLTTMVTNMPHPSRRLLSVALTLVCAVGLRGEDDTLRRDLERAFSGWRTAMVTRSLTAWKENTASFRQMETRNMIVSQKQLFPQALFDFPLRAPETGTLRFIKAEAKGATAKAIYFGKIDVGIPDSGEIPENLLLLNFINEAGQWKFDTLRLMNLASAPDVRASLKNGGAAGILKSPEFSPDGVLPTTAKPCLVPDHIAALQIASLGYATAATVNGFPLPVVADAAEQHIIIGGLKDGENTLKLEIKPTPVAEGSARHLEVNAVVLTGNEAKPVIRVFTWKAPTSSAPEFSNQKIIVNKITMRGD